MEYTEGYYKPFCLVTPPFHFSLLVCANSLSITLRYYDNTVEFRDAFGSFRKWSLPSLEIDTIHNVIYTEL